MHACHDSKTEMLMSEFGVSDCSGNVLSGKTVLGRDTSMFVVLFSIYYLQWSSSPPDAKVSKTSGIRNNVHRILSKIILNII